MWKFNRRTRPKSTGSGKPKRMAAGVLAVAVAAVALTAAPASAGHDDRGRGNDWRGDRGRHSQHDRGRHYGRECPDYNYGHNHGHGHGQVIIDYRPAPACRYIPGRYEERTRQVLVRPAHYDKVWCEPEFGFHYDSRGHRVRFVITQGHYDSVYHPAEYRTECVRVWVPARWVCASGCSHPHHH